MIEGGNEIASFDVANASDEQREEFLKRCIQAYRDTIETEKNCLVYTSTIYDRAAKNLKKKLWSVQVAVSAKNVHRRQQR